MSREGALSTDRVRVDGEVEIHTDLLEEVVADRDEPDLDRDLKVLQPAKLFEEVGHLVMDLRRMANDQADAEEERCDGADRRAVVDAAGTSASATTETATHAVGRGGFLTVLIVHLPASWSDGCADELDQRRHVDILSFAADGLHTTVIDAHGHALVRHSQRLRLTHRRLVHPRDRGGNAERTGLTLAGGHHQVADVIRLRERITRVGGRAGD